MVEAMYSERRSSISYKSVLAGVWAPNGIATHALDRCLMKKPAARKIDILDVQNPTNGNFIRSERKWTYHSSSATMDGRNPGLNPRAVMTDRAAEAPLGHTVALRPKIPGV
jgi:hypothetical protein